MVEPGQQIPTAVIGAMRQLLAPLARLMIRHGITMPAIVEVLKQVLVNVAEKDFPVQGKSTTDSRVSVLTGVHRKDVKRLRHATPVERDVPKSVSLGAEVVNTWVTDPRWQDDKGDPLPLLRQRGGTAEPSFEQLAESVSNDVRARAILDELLRVGVVTIDPAGRVVLLRQAFVPQEAEAEKLYYFERAGAAHLMAGVKNLEGIDPPYFDRMLQYHSIPAQVIPHLQALVEDKGMQLLKELNLEAKKKNRSGAADPQRIVVGMYFYHESAEQD